MVTLSFTTTSSLTTQTITISSHGLQTGEIVRYNSGIDPSPYNIGLTDGSEYYVVKKDDNTLFISSSLDDINFFVAQVEDLIDITENTIYIDDHNLTTGDRVVYNSNGGDPLGGLVNWNTYYVIRVDDNKIKLASSLVDANANIAIDIISTGTQFSHLLFKHITLIPGSPPEQTHSLEYSYYLDIGGTFIPIGGSDTQVLYNSSGSIVGSTGFTFDGSRLTAPALTIDTNTLYVDAINDRVGIGLTSPSQKLHVSGGSTLLVDSTGANGGQLLFLNQATATGTNYALVSSVTGAATNNTGLYVAVTGATNNIGLRIINPPAGSTNYAIYSDAAAKSYFAGNVGIGTTNPGTLLEVFGSITSRVAATQDSVILAGRAGGTSSYGVTLTPTTLSASRTLTLPDTTGTIVTTGDSGTVTSTMIANGTIVDADINASAAIAVSKLAASTISGVTLGNNLNTLTLNVSGTGLSGSTTYNGSAAATFTVTSNATSSNTASTIVARDASGNFSAGTITATTLAGTLSTAAQTNITSLGTLTSLTISGNLTVDTNTLFVDSVNNRVGIGTVSPSFKLEVNDTASFNGVTIGRGAGSISDNTAVGSYSLYSNTTGGTNTAIGNVTLYSNTTGSENVAVGDSALYANTVGYKNTAIGIGSLQNNTTGYTNTAIGYESLRSNTIGIQNSSIGYHALRSNTTGIQNTAVGNTALYSNTVGSYNTSLGLDSLYNNTTGVQNTAVGHNALYSSTVGVYNTAIGQAVMYSNTTGVQNTAVGQGTLYDATTATNNTAIGFNTGRGITTGSKNTIIGANVTGLSTTLANTIIIADGDGNKRIYVDSSGNVGIAQTSPSYKLDITGDARATGTMYAAHFDNVSDISLKTNINSLTNGLEIIKSLNPVSFNWKDTNQKSFGLIAQEVEYILPEIVKYQESDKIKTVSYIQIISLLISAIQEQQKQIDNLNNKA